MIILRSYDLGNSKHDFFPKRNYDKRVDARIIRKGLKKKYGIFHTLGLKKSFSIKKVKRT